MIALADKGRARGVIYPELCKPFDMVTRNILAAKLERYGFDGWTARWIRLDGHIQRVKVNGSVSTWKSVMNGVSQGSVVEQIVFNIFINDIGSGIEYTLSKFTDDTKLSGAVHRLEGRNAIQTDLDRFEEWTHVNMLKSNKIKCKVLYLGWCNPHYQYRQGMKGLGEAL